MRLHFSCLMRQEGFESFCKRILATEAQLICSDSLSFHHIAAICEPACESGDIDLATEREVMH
ncbi:hypothetical protein P409_19435 [Inquilinus limosus MP06]|uniref:Uncharacterized protein n=1 Tax=Inquilinus limosus MP06 TaxID=1398085 RepID=A0A0A0D3U7_9PROT|nr:hypothetical protein P409_19435 [Inquilinus limosus MP06]